MDKTTCAKYLFCLSLMEEATQLWHLVSICSTISHTPCGHDVCFCCYMVQIITEDWDKRFSVFQTETSSNSDHPLMTNLSLIVGWFFFLLILCVLQFLSFGVPFIYTVIFSGERDLLLHLILRWNSAKVNEISTALIVILTVEVNWTSEKLDLDDVSNWNIVSRFSCLILKMRSYTTVLICHKGNKPLFVKANSSLQRYHSC